MAPTIDINGTSYPAYLNIFALRKLESTTGQPFSQYFKKVGETMGAGNVSIDMCLTLLYCACWGAAKAEGTEFSHTEDTFTAMFSIEALEFIVTTAAELMAAAMPQSKADKGSKAKKKTVEMTKS